MDLRAELLSVLVRDLQDVDLVGLSLSEPKLASLLLCFLSVSPSFLCPPYSPWPGPPFILKGIPQLPNCMLDRCHLILGSGEA
jgi:hypothetical protein